MPQGRPVAVATCRPHESGLKAAHRDLWRRSADGERAAGPEQPDRRASASVVTTSQPSQNVQRNRSPSVVLEQDEDLWLFRFCRGADGDGGGGPNRDRSARTPSRTRPGLNGLPPSPAAAGRALTG